MPISKRRKRKSNQRRYSPPASRTPAAMVAQRSVRLLVDELEDLLALVPLTYDSTDIVRTIEHHHHSTAVVNFLRTHDVVGIIAAMGGGAMVIPEQVGTPTVEADTVQSPNAPGVSLDTPALVDVELPFDPPVRTEGLTVPRVPGATVEPWWGPPAEEISGQGVGVDQLERLRDGLAAPTRSRATCDVCGKSQRVRAGTSVLYPHGPIKARCVGRATP